MIFVAPVIRPCASTVNVGIAVALPYDPALTAVASRLIVKVSVALATVVKPVPPAMSTVSPPFTTCEPLSPVNVQDVEIAAVEASVILPCASTVITGTAVLLPYEAALTAVSSRLTVKVLLLPTVLIPVPPAISSVSLSKSIDNAPPESPWKSKSTAPTVVSTYALILC